MQAIYFEYSHAAELAFKAFLRCHYPEVEYGHGLMPYYERCRALGLQIGPDDRTQIGNIVTLLDSANKDQGLRYFMNLGVVPDLAWTSEVVGRLLNVVEGHVARAEPDHLSGLGKPVGIFLIAGKPTSRDPQV